MMKDLDTMTVSKVGQSTLPKWWRETSGLAKGGLVEVRPLRDGKNSIILTPCAQKRRGAVGLAKQFAACPSPITTPPRHFLPFK
jgi:AbrB family looped-hinge helix DNA binding protein